ncbi:MAG: hypothetical protein J0M02_01285 [Planctomycetes bacterium]|nr:hypothetical protein [Planctomycetota bacterium]
MEWFVERNGSREGPYQAAEIAARVSAGNLPAETPVISTTGELILTAGALVAASASLVAPAASAGAIPPPPMPMPRPASWWRSALASIRPFEWLLCGLIISAFILACFPVPWLIVAVPVLASIITIAIDAVRIGVGRLALAKVSLSRMERWPVSTWVVSATVLWPVYTPIYLLKRRRLIACVAEAGRCGSYASVTEMRDAHRGVAGAAVVAAQAPRNRRDVLLQVVCLGAAGMLMWATLWAPWSPGHTQAPSNPRTAAVVSAMQAHAKALSAADVDESLAAMEQVDVSACPEDFRSAYEAHRQVIRDWARRRVSLAEAANRQTDENLRIFVEAVADETAKETDRKIKTTYAELMRVAETYGVALEWKK